MPNLAHLLVMGEEYPEADMTWAADEDVSLLVNTHKRARAQRMVANMLIPQIWSLFLLQLSGDGSRVSVSGASFCDAHTKKILVAKT